MYFFILLSPSPPLSPSRTELTPLELARRKPDVAAAQCMFRVHEMIDILKPLPFDNSEESYDYILNKVFFALSLSTFSPVSRQHEQTFANV